MKNVLKKAIATLTATASLAVGVCSLSASAATGTLNKQNYSSRYIGGGAPGSESFTDVCELYATNAGYYAYCATLNVYGTYGTVTIQCSNYKSNSLVFSQSGKGGTLTISGQLGDNALFTCSCYGNDTVYSTGYVKTGTSPA